MRQRLERLQPQARDDFGQLHRVRTAGVTALEMGLEERALEFGQLAVQRARRILARAIANPVLCPQFSHIRSDAYPCSKLGNPAAD